MENNIFEQKCNDCASSIHYMIQFNDYEKCLDFLEGHGIFNFVITCNECGEAARKKKHKGLSQ